MSRRPKEQKEKAAGASDAPPTSAPAPRNPAMQEDPMATSQTRRRDRLSDVHARPAGERSEERLFSPTPDRVLFSVLALNRQVGPEMHDEETVHAYLDALKQLFPGRRFAIRLIAADTGQLNLVHATGRLLARRRDVVDLSAEALARHELEPDRLPRGVRHTEHYQPIFDDSGGGFDVPLQDGERLFGMLNVEYPPEVEEPEGDRPVVVQIALQLAAALRNARLLRESVYLRDYLSKLLDHANAPILVIGKRRDVRVANRAFLALTGFTREELLGRDFTLLLPESERRRLLPVFIHALRGESTSNFEVRLPRAHGGFARVAMNTASIVSADGEVEGVIAIGRDITEVRQLEEQIIHAEKLATLGQLAAGVVHELNNPLTSISVYSDYLLKKGERGGADAPDLEKLRRIVQSAERILNFTRDLVAYARPSNEEPRLVSIHDVLDQSVVFCEHVIAESGVRVEKRFAGDVQPVYAVKGQLHQVFINLITNACHAMPVGAGQLVIETKPIGEQLIVRLADNGAGIPGDNLDRIFEPFFSTKGEGKGTGLGLSIVRNIVQQHGGNIKVESELGGGTTFEISLPYRT